MFRIGLTVYLAVATLAGPSLCCCTMDRAFVSALDAITKPFAEKSASPSHCCCSTTCSHDSEDSPGKRSPHNPQNCPCKEKSDSRHSMPPTDRVDVSKISLSFDLVAHLVTPTFSLQLVPDLAPVAEEQSATVHLSGQEILLAFQTFRC